MWRHWGQYRCSDPMHVAHQSTSLDAFYNILIVFYQQFYIPKEKISKKWHFDTCDVTGVDTDVPTLCVLHINRRVSLRSTINIKLSTHIYDIQREKIVKNLKKCDVFVTYVTFASCSIAQKLFNSASGQYEDFGTRTSSLRRQEVELSCWQTYIHTHPHTHPHTDTRTPNFFWLYRVQGPLKREEKS